MRIIPFAISAVATILLVFLLNKKWGAIPPLGKFLSPQHGFWQNAESADKDFDAELKFPGLHGKMKTSILYRATCMQSFVFFKWNCKPCMQRGD